jgi:ribosomal protein S18 acetylase RimI-like enzyme
MQTPPGVSALDGIRIRPATAADIERIVALDQAVTGLPKPGYWQDMVARSQPSPGGRRFFLVAEDAAAIDGFIVGEIRSWEFGSPPIGWIFAVQVRPALRAQGLGTRLFDAICGCFRHAGVHHVRTMVARDNTMIHAFFRSQGMTAGPFLELEMRLD